MRPLALKPARKPRDEQLPSTHLKKRAVLEFVDKFDALFSHQIYAWFGHHEATRKHLRELTRLGYIGLVDSERAVEFAKSLPPTYTPYAVKDHGKTLLGENASKRVRFSDPFAHKMHRCSVEFSGAIGARQHGIEFLTLEDVLREYPRDISNPHHLIENYLKPDIPIFGFKGKKTFYAHGEIDTGSEQQNEGKGRGESIEEKLHKYNDYFLRRGYFERYGVRGMSLLFWFTKPGRVPEFENLIRTHVDPEVWPYIGWQIIPDFASFREVTEEGKTFLRRNYPPATGFALTDDYETLAGSLNIMELVNGYQASKGAARQA